MQRCVVAFVIGLVLCAPVFAAHNRTYDRSIEGVWDEVVKAVRDVDFVLIDSDRSKHELTMRTKSRLSSKRGMVMEVKLTREHSLTTVHVWAADPAKAERLAKHILRYLEALDRRMS